MYKIKTLICVGLIFLGIPGGISTYASTTSQYGENIQKYMKIELPKKEVYNFLGNYFYSDLPQSYQYIDVYFTGVGKKTTIYKNLQKLIYSDILSNNTGRIFLNKPLDLYSFFMMVEHITGYDFATQETKDILQSRNVTIGDILVVKDIFDNYEFEVNIQAGSNDTLHQAFSSPEEYEKIQIFIDVYTTLLKQYYGKGILSVEDMLYGGIEGMVKGVGDDHTVFFPPTESKDFSDSLSGEFVGIGVYLELVSPGEVEITGLINNGPAQKSGILPGDKIIKVDNFQVTTKSSLSDVTAKIKGDKNTIVNITIERGGDIFTYKITRNTVIVYDIETDILQDTYFYIKINSFGEKVEQEFAGSLNQLVTSGKKDLIIDLRDNPGGYLDQVSKMLGHFVPKGDTVVRVLYEGYGENISSQGANPFIDLEKHRVYILMNQNSASASEILIGTLKDYFPHIQLIGTQTYGKGSVQALREYNDGSSLKYTIAQWKTGKTATIIDGIGVTPDIEIELDIDKKKKGIDTQLEYILSPHP